MGTNGSGFFQIFPYWLCNYYVSFFINVIFLQDIIVGIVEGLSFHMDLVELVPEGTRIVVCHLCGQDVLRDE